MAGDGNDFPLVFHPEDTSTVRRVASLLPSLSRRTGLSGVRWAEAPWWQLLLPWYCQSSSILAGAPAMLF